MEESDLDYDRAALSRETAIIGTMAREFSADKAANAISQLVNLAETLGKLGQEHAEQVAKLRNSVKEALIVQQDCEAHKVALNAVGQMLLTSGPDLETTDFKQLLSVKRQLILDDLGYDPEQTREIQDFDRTVASARGDGADEGAACMTDDDLVMQTGVDDVAANKACPITMTSVFDIEDPVEDEQRIVYERQSVEKYIRSKQHTHGTSVPCPLAGSSHTISLASLRKATGVLRAQKRRQRQMATRARNGDAADGVLDVD